MDLNSIKIGFTPEGHARISIDDKLYKLVYIGFGVDRVVYNYMDAGEMHSIIVGADHFDNLPNIVTIKDEEL